MENLFKLEENNTDVKTEITAGATTFISMVYILAVNPSILSASGMDPAGVFTATAVSAAFASMLMGFMANYPVALASGMGLNAYFASSVCIPMARAGINDPWQIALTAVLIEGILFVILTVCKFREALLNDIPANLKLGITAGIGLFIAMVGMTSAGIVKGTGTSITLGDLSSPPVYLALTGFLILMILNHYKVPGFILWSILITWGLGMIAQATGHYHVTGSSFSLLPDFSSGFKPAAPEIFAFNFQYMFHHGIEFAVIVFSFLFVDLFDTVGCLIGIGIKTGFMDENGNLPRAGRALMSDAVGTIFGACVGTSTVTSYAESCTGIAAGGRTGLTALTTGLLFLAALPLSPAFVAIPEFATTPALMFVGLLMVTSVKSMDFENDAADSISGFLAIVIMPFTYSIANGIMFGILSYVIVRIFQGRIREVGLVLWISFALFVLRLITLVV